MKTNKQVNTTTMDNLNFLGALTFDGSGKNYKTAYIQSFLASMTQNNTKMLEASRAQDYRTICNTFIMYIPNPEKRLQLKKLRDRTYQESLKALEESKRGKKDATITNDEKMDCWIDACFEAMGAVIDYFQEAWNFEKTRGIGVAGPFGDKGRRFFSIYDIPPDGKYLKVPDNYVPKSGEEVYDFNIRSRIMMTKMDEQKNYDEINDVEGDDEEEEVMDFNGQEKVEMDNPVGDSGMIVDDNSSEFEINDSDDVSKEG